MIADKRIISLMLILLMAACHTTNNFTSVDRSGFNDLESGFYGANGFYSNECVLEDGYSEVAVGSGVFQFTAR